MHHFIEFIVYLCDNIVKNAKLIENLCGKNRSLTLVTKLLAGNIDIVKEVINKTEIKDIISLLNKANGRIKTHILASTGWYKCPNFTFLNDTSLEKSKNIEALFAQIRKTKSEEE